MPGADWLTPGTTTIPFVVTVENQGDQVQDFDITDYVDTTVFTFDPANNPAGTTTGSAALPFTWDTTNPAAPVAEIVGVFANGDTAEIPVVLTVIDAGGPLVNWQRSLGSITTATR